MQDHPYRLATALAGALLVPSNSAIALSWLPQEADLSLSLAATVANPLVGTDVTFTLTGTNLGPRTADEVLVDMLLPDGYEYVSDDGNEAYDPLSGIWSAGSLSDDASKTLRIDATVLATGEYRNTAEISSSLDDPELDNNVAAVEVVPREGTNVVVIMLDDLDDRSLQDMLSAGLLPNLQSEFVDQGIEFSNAYVTNSLCCPSRATFLTGQYSHNHGVLANNMFYDDETVLAGGVGAFDDRDTLATRLQELGYLTAFVGKYLNGYGSSSDLGWISAAFEPTYVPPGWSNWHALIDPTTACMYNYQMNNDGVVTDYDLPAGEEESTSLYQTHVLTDLMETFVLQHVDELRPFFLYVSPFAPHFELCEEAYGGPRPTNAAELTIRPAPADNELAVPEFVPSVGFYDDITDKPAWLSIISDPANSLDALASQYRQRLRSLVAVDRLIGRLRAAADSELDKTAIIFTSDNGWVYGEHHWIGKDLGYRESIRVPLYIRMPSAIATEREDLVLNNDLAPTILDLADPGYFDPDFDGRSIEPLLRDVVPADWVGRQQFLFEHWRLAPEPGYGAPSQFAVRRSDVLYIETTNETVERSPPRQFAGLELYDLAVDTAELDSLLHHPEDAPDPDLSSWLGLLRECAGESCMDLENQP